MEVNPSLPANNANASRLTADAGDGLAGRFDFILNIR
jgi:hypothetical protein